MPSILFFDMQDVFSPLIKGCYRNGYLPIIHGSLSELVQRDLQPFVPWESFYSPDLSKRAEEQIHRIADELGEALGTTTSLNTFLSPLGNFLPHTGQGFFRRLLDVSFRQVVAIEMFKAMIQKHDVALVVLRTENDPTERAIIKIASLNRIPTLHIAHGIFSYTPTPVAGEYNRALRSDYIAVFGKRARDILIRHGFDSSRIFMAGSPYWDSLYSNDARISQYEARKKLGLDPEKPVVLFCPSYTVGNSMFFFSKALDMLDIHKYVNAAISSLPNEVELIVRPHPWELARNGLSAENQERLMANYKEWLRSEGITRLTISRKDKVQCIRAADVVIVYGMSTIIPEAMILERPVISLITRSRRKESRVYDKHDGIIVVKCITKLDRVINSVIADHKIRERIISSQNTSIDEFNYGNDGKAQTRLLSLVLSLINNNQSNKHSEFLMQSSSFQLDGAASLPANGESIPDAFQGEKPELRKAKNGYFVHPVGKLSRGAVLDVGLKCTHSCRFCYYSFLGGTKDQFRGMRHAKFRTLEECKEILRLLKQNGFMNFDYTGGEPSLHPDIIEITRYAHQELGLKGRMITLGQFLMKKTKNCRHAKLIEDLLQAGMVNFLFSLHAVDEELFHKTTGGSFEKLRQAMNFLDAKGFCYTANTTVFEWNYQHLPTIAEEIIKHRIYLHNFIIMNAYHEWNKDGKAFGVQAKYADIYPHLRKAVDILEANNIGVNIRYAPLCTVKGMEKNLVGMVGVRYDPYEWMNLAGHFGGPPELCASVIPLQEGQIENYVAYRSVNAQFDNGVKITGARGEVKYFSDRCVVCRARDVCDGIDPNYLKIYGSSEFLPYDEPERAPLQKARYAYKIPFMVKTEQYVDMKKAVAEAFKLLPSQHTAAARTTAETQRHPRVSVIIPCYNYARYLPDAVRSVTSQTFQDFEIIIVNDGSTDNSLEVARELIRSDATHRIKLIDQPNSGQPAISRNRGISEARGEYILCLDADDMIAPTLLEECVALLDANPDISIAYPDQLYLLNSGKSKVIPAVDWDFSRLRYANQLPYCSVYRLQVWEDTGGYNTNVRGYEDWDFWIAAGAKGHIGKRIPKALFHYRWHGSGVYSQAVGGDERLRSQIMLNHPQLYDQRSIEKASEVLGQRPSKSSEDKPRRPGLSFCIITAGNRNEKLQLLIESIHLQHIPAHEIIVAGAVEDLGVSGIKYVPMPNAAKGGRTSMMRNAAAEHSVYDNLVFCDDDIVLTPNWSSALHSVIRDYDLLTPTILNLDGTRHWDKASIDQRTQKILNFHESSPHIYLTSGILVVRAAVWQAVKWNERLGFYEAEDVDFSRRAQQMGFRLGFCRDAIAIHNDARYTQVGRVVLKRTEAGAEAFLDGTLERLSVSQLVQRAQEEYRNKHYAEMADCLRCCLVKDPGKLPARDALRQLEDLTGGRADSAPWQPRPILSPSATLEHQFGRHGEFPAATKELMQVIHYYQAPASSPMPHLAQQPEPVGIKWGSHILGFSGHAAHARLCLRSLDKHGVPLAMEPFAYDEQFLAQQPPEEVERWQRLLKADVKAGAYLCFAVPLTMRGEDVFQSFRRTNPAFEVFVGAATFETDRLPPGWAKALSGVDEVWVPSTFNQATFGHAGVDAGRIQVFPTGIDAERFDPERVKPLAVAGRRGFTFLSVFQWTKRKGWDILLKAYLEAFDAHDDVCLVLRAYPFRSRHISLRQKIDDFLHQCGRSPQEAPPIILLDQFLPETDMPSLYAAADAFVLPTRGEGFGLPFLEAMAAGLPTIGTGWGGHLDFMNEDNSYLLDVDGLVAIPAEQTHESPFYTPDQRWAEPSVQHTAETLRVVFDHREPALTKGAKARSDVKRHWTEERCARWITERVNTLLAPRGKKVFAIRDQSAAQQPSEAPVDSRTIVVQDPSGKPPLFWTTPLFDPSGYADEARHLILGAAPRWTIKIRPAGRSSEAFAASLPPVERRLFDKMLETPLCSPFIHIMQTPAKGFFRDPGAVYNVGRTVFETDRLPAHWIERCNRMDEIWVPTPFNKETFERAGVSVPIHVIPQGVDGRFFHPGAQPLPLPRRRGFVFLSVFEWVHRKGWDVLLRSWAETFSPEEDVCLVLRTYCFNAIDHEQNETEINRRIDEFFRDRLGCSRRDVAPIIVLADQVPQYAMAGLYTAADAFVLPSRGEGWGRPYIEAMACGLPVIGTRWSGNLTFMNDENSFLIDTNGLEEVGSEMEFDDYRGHQWSVPSADHLKKLLRQVFEDREEARRRGAAARRDVTTLWTWEKAGAILNERLTAIVEKIAASNATPNRAATPLESSAARPIRLVWEGAQLAHHSLALVNREVCGQLLRRKNIELSLIPLPPQEIDPALDPSYERLVGIMHSPLSGPPDIHVRHYWPPHFTPPPAGRWVMIQPWEYGRLPEEWIKPMTHLVDEIWVPSRHVLKTYLASGIPADRVSVIPNGVNTAVFHPEVPPLPLGTSKTFRFLFVGGTIWRKGIDLLLAAYAKAFRRQDDVVLVIKDMGQNSFYLHQGAGDAIRQLQGNPEAPEILYLTDTLNEQQMPGLFTACSCLVHPYRGEGFGLPVLEAMACGVPVMVTAGGATDDFCSADSAYLIPSRPHGISSTETRLVGGLGWVLEADAEELVKMLRHVYEHPDEARQKAQQALATARSAYSWEKIADLVAERMRSLAAKPIRRLHSA